VSVSGEQQAAIGPGLLILLGVAGGDGLREAAWMAGKLAGLRVFADDEGRMNLSIRDTGGEALVVSQFTLLGDVSRGNRPGFDAAAPAEKARELYEAVVAALKREGINTESGVFGAAMAVELVNDGPVTIILESPST
jgi:D-tyrosyl-tRNA(Tyr) deacylase